MYMYMYVSHTSHIGAFTTENHYTVIGLASTDQVSTTNLPLANLGISQCLDGGCTSAVVQNGQFSEQLPWTH